MSAKKSSRRASQANIVRQNVTADSVLTSVYQTKESSIKNEHTLVSSVYREDSPLGAEKWTELKTLRHEAARRKISVDSSSAKQVSEDVLKPRAQMKSSISLADLAEETHRNFARAVGTAAELGSVDREKLHDILAYWKGSVAASDWQFSTSHDTETRRQNTLMLAVVVVSHVLLVIHLILGWNGREVVPSLTTNIIKSVNCFLTLVLLAMHLQYYLSQLQSRIERTCIAGVRMPKATIVGLLKDDVLWQPFVLGFCVFLLVPIPFIDPRTPYGKVFSEKIGLFMVLRIYVVFRVLRDYSLVYRTRNSILTSQYAAMFGVPNFDWALSLKYFLYSDPGRIIIAIAVYCIGWVALIVYVIEREAQPEDFSFFISTYFTLITMSSTGYGDYTADSVLGKLASMGAAVTGLFVNALLVALLSTKIALDVRQEYAVCWLKIQEVLEEERELAATFLQQIWRRRKNLQKLDAKEKSYNRKVQKIRSEINGLRDNFKTRMADLRNVLHMVASQGEQVLPRLIELEVRNEEFHLRAQRSFDDIRARQDALKTRIENIATGLGQPRMVAGASRGKRRESYEFTPDERLGRLESRMIRMENLLQDIARSLTGGEDSSGITSTDLASKLSSEDTSSDKDLIPASAPKGSGDAARPFTSTEASTKSAVALPPLNIERLPPAYYSPGTVSLADAEDGSYEEEDDDEVDEVVQIRRGRDLAQPRQRGFSQGFNNGRSRK